MLTTLTKCDTFFVSDSHFLKELVMLARRTLIALVTIIAIGVIASISPLVFNILLIIALSVLGLLAWGIAVLMTIDSWRGEKTR